MIIIFPLFWVRLQVSCHSSTFIFMWSSFLLKGLSVRKSLHSVLVLKETAEGCFVRNNWCLAMIRNTVTFVKNSWWWKSQRLHSLLIWKAYVTVTWFWFIYCAKNPINTWSSTGYLHSKQYNSIYGTGFDCLFDLKVLPIHLNDQNHVGKGHTTCMKTMNN